MNTDMFHETWAVLSNQEELFSPPPQAAHRVWLLNAGHAWGLGRDVFLLHALFFLKKLLIVAKYT